MCSWVILLLLAATAAVAGSSDGRVPYKGRVCFSQIPPPSDENRLEECPGQQCLPGSKCIWWAAGKLEGLTDPPATGRAKPPNRCRNTDLHGSFADDQWVVNPDGSSNSGSSAGDCVVEELSRQQMWQCLAGARVLLAGDSMSRGHYLRLIAYLRGFPEVGDHHFHIDSAYATNGTDDVFEVAWEDSWVEPGSQRAFTTPLSPLPGPFVDKEPYVLRPRSNSLERPPYVANSTANGTVAPPEQQRRLRQQQRRQQQHLQKQGASSATGVRAGQHWRRRQQQEQQQQQGGEGGGGGGGPLLELAFHWMPHPDGGAMERLHEIVGRWQPDVLMVGAHYWALAAPLNETLDTGLRKLIADHKFVRDIYVATTPDLNPNATYRSAYMKQWQTEFPTKNAALRSTIPHICQPPGPGRGAAAVTAAGDTPTAAEASRARHARRLHRQQKQRPQPWGQPHGCRGSYVLPFDTMARAAPWKQNPLDNVHFQCMYMPHWPNAATDIKTPLLDGVEGTQDCRDLLNLNILQVLLNSICSGRV